jgi:hypothetical protein
MATKSDMTTKFTDVDVARLNFTDFEENQRSKGQKISYPRYTLPENGSEVPLFIQFPWVDMKSYGVPKIGEYYADDTQRSFVKLPLDQSVPDIKQLSDLLKQIDEKLGSDEFKEKMFGTKASKYEYQPIFRMPQEEDEDTKKETKKDYGPKHPYMKLKIDTSFPDNQVKTIIFNSVLKDGKRTRTKVEGVKTIDEFASHVCWMCRVHPVVRPVKLWAQAPNKKDPTYGLTFKIAKTEVEPPNKTNSNVKQFLESDAFLDSDEESDTVETVKTTAPLPSTSVKSKQPAQPAQVAQVASDDESEDESDEEVVTKSSASKTLAKKVVESEDEDESEEEVKPAKKPPAPKPTTKTATASKPKKTTA